MFVAPGAGHDPGAGRRGRAAGHGARRRPRAIGATASGVIGDGHGREHGPAVAAWAAVLPGVRDHAYRLEVTRAGDSLHVGGLPQPASDDRVAAMLVDPYTFPISAFLERGNSAAPGFPLVGGLAGAAGGAGANRLFCDGDVLEQGGVGVVIGGETGAVGARAVVSQGCRPIGPAMIVTRAERNMLLELAGQPAYTRLVEIVSALPPAEQEMATRGLHLGVAIDEYADEHGRGDFLIRGVVGADEESGAVAVGEVIEVGQTVRFQVRDAAGAGEDLTELLDGEPTRPGRAAVLLQRAWHHDVPRRRPRRPRGKAALGARRWRGSSRRARSARSAAATTCTASPPRCSRSAEAEPGHLPVDDLGLDPAAALGQPDVPHRPVAGELLAGEVHRGGAAQVGDPVARVPSTPANGPAAVSSTSGARWPSTASMSLARHALSKRQGRQELLGLPLALRHEPRRNRASRLSLDVDPRSRVDGGRANSSTRTVMCL